jgi:thymidylate kinase
LQEASYGAQSMFEVRFPCILINRLQRLQEQDKRNHEAYIRSGEIFEDRQQAYEKMTKGYEKLLASCQSWVVINIQGT